MSVAIADQTNKQLRRLHTSLSHEGRDSCENNCEAQPANEDKNTGAGKNTVQCIINDNTSEGGVLRMGRGEVANEGLQAMAASDDHLRQELRWIGA